MNRSKWVMCWLGALFVAVALASEATIAGADDSSAAGTNTTSGAKLTDDQLGEMLQAAVIMSRMGMYDEAEAQCVKILEQKPDEPTVKRMLAEIQDLKRQRNPSADLRRKVETIVIPEIGVRAAPVSDVIEYLQGEAQKQSKDKSVINFVWQAPEETKAAKVTLNLRGVPLSDALKYVTEGVGLRYRVDAHAVVIYKSTPATPQPANVKSP